MRVMMAEALEKRVQENVLDPVGPSQLGAALLLHKVSSFFQVVATPPGATDVLDRAGSNPI